MDETIIKNHNSRVKEDDEVYYLGDFCFRNSRGGKPGEGEIHKAKYYLDRLNGKFIFTAGNHDNNNSLNVITQRMVIKYGGYRINLVHRPDFVDVNYPINFVGHVHSRWDIQRIKRGEAFTDAINMSCEVWNYTPASFEEIFKKYYRWLKENNYGKTT
jgi:calcineurin-like phosphoesterase family protein